MADAMVDATPPASPPTELFELKLPMSKVWPQPKSMAGPDKLKAVSIDAE